MAKTELIMPKMGEGVIEATILKWVKNIGDSVSYDDTIVEIATDKVDSEIPSPVDGKIIEILYQENDVVAVGKVIAIIETEGEARQDKAEDSPEEKEEVPQNLDIEEKPVVAEAAAPVVAVPATQNDSKNRGKGKFYSPLVRNMAKAENISESELDSIQGSGHGGRVIKRDVEAYLEKRKTIGNQGFVAQPAVSTPVVSGDVEIIQMDRMRKLIADYMVQSKRIAPHVTSMVEADLTNVFRWRKSNKEAFFEKYKQKLTFTPIFIQAIVRAIKDFPMINVSVDGDKIIVKKNINIGMATALPSGNLIVPVIKNADLLSLAGLATAVNDLAYRARNSQLKPDEIQGSTYTLTNLGSFGNVIGTPIINQPEVAIMATGAIRKKPAVLETEDGDVIAIRQMMYLSHAYDHRVVDGFLGGSFVRRVADYLENFDHKQSI
jgi:2-oxoglutarate dehydrogenase E2 component (dihydrolipoamide succinyltransferase)